MVQFGRTRPPRSWLAWLTSIFDPQTYAYLGATDQYELDGMFTDNTVALVKSAIVDRTGQLP